MLGNPAYLSAYVMGVAQAMAQLGHWHRDVSVLDDLDRVARQLEEMRPDVIWTHTIPWVPREAPARRAGCSSNLLADWRKRGARVLLHDGDPRVTTRHPYSCRRASTWRSAITACRARVEGPGGALALRRDGAARDRRAVDALRCGLLFAGIVRKDDGLYSPRTDLLGVLREKLGERMTIRTGGVNDRMQVADVAARRSAVLGFGRPEVPGWVDTRVFQYPAPAASSCTMTRPSSWRRACTTSTSIAASTPRTPRSASRRARAGGARPPEMRAAPFEHVQAHHTWRHRVERRCRWWGSHEAARSCSATATTTPRPTCAAWRRP
jgi:hypothetical protein